jgi:hypothetical protein
MNRPSLSALRALSPTCREAATLISAADIRPLTRWERVGLRLHLLICRACRAYRSSVRTLRVLVGRVAAMPPDREAEPLPEAARQRILQVLLLH